MKKLLLLFLLITLTSCQETSPLNFCDTKDHDYDEIAERIITWEAIFSIQKADYYCYIFSTRCSHCNNIKSLVISTALDNDNFFFVLFISDIPISSDVSNTIGATSYIDVTVLGTPTLLRIENGMLTMNIAGENQITQYLEKPCKT